MHATTNDPGHDRALDAMRRSFHGGDFPAVEAAGHALLAAIDPATIAASEQIVRASALLLLVRCARRTDALDTALASAYSGIAAARAAGDARLECQLWAQYVHVLANMGQNQTALEEGYKALKRASDSGDAAAQAACWLALGQVHWAMQQWRDGEQAYTQSLALALSCGDKGAIGLASNGLAAMKDQDAKAARSAGREEESMAHARHSFALLEDFTHCSIEIGDTYNAWMGTYNQACCLFGMGEHEAARDLLNTQLTLLNGERGSRRQLILQMLGDIHLAEGRHDLAITCETEALEIGECLQLPILAMDACHSLVAALEGSGDCRAALAEHRRYHALYVQLASNKAQAHARAMAVMYETEKTLALAEAQRKRADQLAAANNSLVLEKAVLQRSSMEDALTGLPNRRCFDLALREALGADGSPRDNSMALALIDVDHFKRVNDRFSHLVGDEVLRRLGILLQRCCRKPDLAARFGGEEFALILAGVDLIEARAACERVRASVESEPWWTVHAELRVTVSIGVAHVLEQQAGAMPFSLLGIADARLYAAKSGGRNRVMGSSI